MTCARGEPAHEEPATSQGKPLAPLQCSIVSQRFCDRLRQSGARHCAEPGGAAGARPSWRPCNAQRLVSGQCAAVSAIAVVGAGADPRGGDRGASDCGVLHESFIHPLTILSTLPSAGLSAPVSSRMPWAQLPGGALRAITDIRNWRQGARGGLAGAGRDAHSCAYCKRMRGRIRRHGTGHAV